MLTVKQPPTYGYKSVHDLPTPPSTSRPSPPLIYQETPYKHFPPIPRSHSPSSQHMSAPHRGLPPPAAMIPQPPPPQQQQPPPPPAAAPQPPSHHSQPPPPLAQSQHQQQQQQQQAQQAWNAGGGLPPPPPQWLGAEEGMRDWLQARAEEEKTKQETLRLEQRRVEMDILRASLSGGIPPPMVPLVFAGMGTGVPPQAALDWAQQFMQSSQGHHGQQMLPGPHSPEHQRDVAPGQYTAANTPSSVPGGYGPYPGSPTRQRGQTVGPTGRPVGTASNLPSLNTNVAQPGQGLPPSAMPPHQAHQHVQAQSAQQQQQQQEASPGIYFHHWQPPTSQSGSSSNPPGTPSGDTPRKRKAVGPQQPAPAPSDHQRFRSPPPFVQSSLSNPPPARRGHSRRRSDVSWYRPHEGADRPQQRGMSPVHAQSSHSRERELAEPRKHSVSAMLSGEPSSASQQQQQQHHQHQQGSPLHAQQHHPRAASRSPVEQRYGDDGSDQARAQHRTPPSESRPGSVPREE